MHSLYKLSSSRCTGFRSSSSLGLILFYFSFQLSCILESSAILAMEATSVLFSLIYSLGIPASTTTATIL
ncbi:hypothetical protein F5Y08DRAFT_274746 [Xylaria arbuscula]|nr:hypothetical protein F5Y08DRAFT_274746 [Xylaria arbuscula]